MYLKHTGQPHKALLVSDSYQKVSFNKDNYDDQTGVNAILAYESFSDALTLAGSNKTTIIVDKAVSITEDATIPSTVHLIVRPGGSFSISAGKTLTISGTIDSCGQDASTVFTGAGTYAHTTESSNVGPVYYEMNMTENTKIIEIYGNVVDLTHGARQGAINIDVTRSSSYAMTGTDGNPDTGLKVTVKNRSASGTYGRTRALDITADLRDAGSAGQFVEGMQMTAKTRSGTTVVDVTTARFIIDHGANGSGSIVGVQVQDVSQSATGTMYGFLLNTSNYNITREFGIFIDSNAGSWTNAISFNGTVTNVFDFESTDGTNGAGYDAGFTGPAGYAVPDGYIKVDIGGNTTYLYTWDTLPT